MRCVDLSANIGLQSRLNLDTGEIDFEGVKHQTIVRTVRDIIEAGVFFDAKTIPKSSLDNVICWIYRLIDDDNVLRLQGLSPPTDQGYKYDITVLLPYNKIAANWTGEFPKTTGHYHLPMPGKTTASPDFYQISYGAGQMILQQKKGNLVSAFRLSPAVLDPVIIAPEFGHTVINIGEDPLVFSNICVRSPHLDYGNIRKFHGAPNYVCRDPNGAAKIVENPHYAQAGITVEKSMDLEPSFDLLLKHGIVPGKPLYTYIGKHKLEFLLQPELYLELFSTALKPKIE